MRWPYRARERTRFGSEIADATGETCGPTGAAAKHRAVSGTLGCHLEQLREACGPHAEDAHGAAKLPWAPPKAVGKGRVPVPLFNGRGALGRTLIARAAAEEEQRRLPLQKVVAGTLPLEWVRRRLNNKTLRRFDAVWRNALQSPEPHSSNHKPKMRFNGAIAKEMERAGVICEASQKPAKGLAAPFAVVEGKTAGLRRCFVALPKGKSDHDNYEANAPFRQHVSRCLVAAFGEIAAVFDLKASFFRVSLPQGSRTSFRCRTQMGRFSGAQAAPNGI
ncbi:hypothetical protein TRVL_08705 [Trypanosoma vivax]|nr:hypothetical protein TRVL_08705 [Trypanosoma vivax]